MLMRIILIGVAFLATNCGDLSQSSRLNSDIDEVAEVVEDCYESLIVNQETFSEAVEDLWFVHKSCYGESHAITKRLVKDSLFVWQDGKKSEATVFVQDHIVFADTNGAKIAIGSLSKDLADSKVILKTTVKLSAVYNVDESWRKWTYGTDTKDASEQIWLEVDGSL